MSNKASSLKDNHSTNKQPETAFEHYLDAGDFKIKSVVTRIRQSNGLGNDNKMSSLKTRRAVEDVLEMQRYRQLLHSDDDQDNRIIY